MPIGAPNNGAHARRLTAEQVAELRQGYRDGTDRRTLVAASGFLSDRSLNELLRGRSYAWVPGALEAHEMREFQRKSRPIGAKP